MQVRFDNTVASIADVTNAVKEFIEIFETILDSQWQYIAASYQLAGTTVSIPTAIPTQPTPGQWTQDQMRRPLQMTFQGRSVGGRRVSLSLYGHTISQTGDFRITKGENPNVDSAVIFLNQTNANFPGTFLAIDGLDPYWKEYANMNYNSYYERRARA